MAEAEHEKGEHPPQLAALLGQALEALLTGRTLPHAENAALQSCFPGASSLRVALALTVEQLGFISSDLRSATGPPTYFATPLGRSFVGRVLASARTAVAQGPVIHHLPDLAHLAVGGAASFVCFPVLRAVPPPGGAPGPAVAAILLCYPAGVDASQEELRQALLLAAQLTQQHGRCLADYVSRLSDALRPSEHAAWGPGVDPEYPEIDTIPPLYCDSPESVLTPSGSASTSAGTSGGTSGGSGPAAPLSSVLANAPGRVVPHPAARWSMSASTLRFGDERLECKFQQWRNTRLARADTAALLALLVYYGSACFLPPSSSARPTCLSAALAALVPGALLLLSRSTRWYIRHRDQLLICTYVLLACHHALQASSQLGGSGGSGGGGGMSEGLWRSLSGHVELLWCVALGVILQVQFVGQCLMLTGGVVLKALVQPGCTARLAGLYAWLAGGPGVQRCLSNTMARQLLLSVVLPCGLAYYAELTARRTFCRSVTSRWRRAGRL